MVRRYELSHEAFGLLADLLPPTGQRGGQWNDHRTTLNGIFWILHSGAQWRELPERYGKWPSVYDRYNRWRKDGTIDRMLERLHLQLDAEGRVDVELWCIDATQIRASRAAAGSRLARRERNVAGEPADHALGRSRGGFGTKLHLVVSCTGVPLAVTITPGEKSECQQVAPALARVRLPRARPRRRRTRPVALAGDKGYSFSTVRRYLGARGIRAVIPSRSNQRANPHFDKATYRERNIIERVFGWLKGSRRLATRYEKLAVNFLAMVKLAMIQRCLALLDSSDRALGAFAAEFGVGRALNGDPAHQRRRPAHGDEISLVLYFLPTPGAEFQPPGGSPGHAGSTREVSMTLAGFILASLAASAFCRTALGQKPPHEAIATYVVPPANLTASPLPFRREQSVSFSASLVAPQQCSAAAIGMRIYNVDDTSSEPTGATTPLIQTGSNYDFSAAAGTKIQISFDAVGIPQNAGPRLYAVVWNFCTVRIPKGINEEGKIIWDTEQVAFSLGSATFRFDCGTGGKTTSYCAYRKE